MHIADGTRSDEGFSFAKELRKLQIDVIN